jgi:hypothetical protein
MPSFFGLPSDVEIYQYGDTATYPYTMDDINRAIDSMSPLSRVNTGNLKEPDFVDSIFDGIPKIGGLIGETAAGVISPLMNQLFLVMILVIVGMFVFSKIKVKGLVG